MSRRLCLVKIKTFKIYALSVALMQCVCVCVCVCKRHTERQRESVCFMKLFEISLIKNDRLGQFGQFCVQANRLVCVSGMIPVSSFHLFWSSSCTPLPPPHLSSKPLLSLSSPSLSAAVGLEMIGRGVVSIYSLRCRYFASVDGDI